MKPSPCRGCAERSKACWGSCEKYREWRADQVKPDADARKRSVQAHLFLDAAIQRSIKIRNRKKRK